MLDVGTGSGILADAAHRLGAGAVVGCDIDLDSALIARRNLPDAVAVFAGSVRSIRPASFDLVVANLNAATLTALGRTLVECGRPGGKCILSGVRKEEIALLEGIAGAKATSTLMLEGWVSLEL